MATPHYPKFHTYKHKPFSYMVKRKINFVESWSISKRLKLIESTDGPEVINLYARREEEFIYIRLLCLHPAASGDALIGSIVERKLSTKDRTNNQVFEALSYCWGPYPKNDSEWKSLSIVESDGCYMFAIRSSLAAALRRLRNKENEYQFLWVDAICIDQTNNDEKSQQIPLMDKIFQSARRVCIWLGNEKKDDDVVVVAKHHIMKIVKPEGFESLINPVYTDQWAALASLMKREWFSRRWVIQEIAYARQAMVYWDDQCLDWQDLADAVALFGSKAPEIAELFKQDPKYNHRADFLGDVEALSANRLVQTIGKVFRKVDNGQHVKRLLSLEFLISELSAFNASRPHDIIYAVLSLAKDTITSTTQPEPIQQSPPTRRHSVSHTAHSRGPSQRIDPAALQTGPVLLGSQLHHNNDIPPTTPVQGPQDDNYHDLMCDEWEKSSQKIKEYGFDDDQIDIARTRLRQHVAACPEEFNYNIMVQKLDLPKNDTISTTIGKRFWDAKSVSWIKKGTRGHAALTLKLLLYERSLEQIAESFVFKLRGRVQTKKFHVDYEKKFYEVCQDFIHFTIRSSRSLDMLFRPWAPDNEDLPIEDREPYDLPSWICPLSRSPFLPRPDGNFGRVNADLLVGMPNTGGTVYKTSSSTLALPEQYFFGGSGKRRLFVTGLMVDIIRETATEAVEGNIPSSWLTLGGWHDTTKPPPESFWKTIVADRNEKGQNPPSYYQRACQYAFGQRTHRGSLNTGRLIDAKISQVVTDYVKRVQTVVWMRKLIRTDTGDDTNSLDLNHPKSATRSQSPLSRAPTLAYQGVYPSHSSATAVDTLRSVKDFQYIIPQLGRLGLVPHTAREGDYICVLRGCSVPVVVRMLSDDQASDPETQEQLRKLKDQATGTEWKHQVCQLIGECYVHGIMDGEVFKMREHKGLQDTIFEIV